ncbi:MAG: FecR domain-containing protein, partial [Sphingomonas sp.]
VQVVGINAVVLNSVRIRRAGTPMPFPAAVRQRVALADEVQTGLRSQLQILLLDRSTFTVGANARLTIDRFVYDPNRGAGAMGATVAKGAFRFMSGRPHTGGGSTINTPTASIGIRGTVVEGVIGADAVRIFASEPGVGMRVESDPGTASLIILRGPGRATQGRTAPGAIDVTAGGRTVTLDRPMLATFVPRPGAAPSMPFVISRAGLQRVQALIFPSLAEQLGFADPEVTQAPEGPNPFATIPPPREPRGPPPPGFGPDLSGPPPGQDGRGYVPSLPNLQQPGPRTRLPPPARTAPQPTPTPGPNQPQPAPVTASPVTTTAPIAAPPAKANVPQQPAPQPSPAPTSIPKPTFKGPSATAPSNQSPNGVPR